MGAFITKLREDIRWFFRQKIYVIALAITAVCSYGFEITHPAIGIDDTAVELYLEDGLEVVMGRWTVFLINKLFHLSEFAPFMLEFVGVILFMLGITLFCVLLRRFFGDHIDVWGYTVFACIFLSNPIISEVYVYYYHDGSDLAYVLIGLALLCFLKAIDMDGKWRAKLPWYVKSMLFAWVAVGCYESFLILYILGILALLFLCGMTGRRRLSTTFVLKNLGIGALLSAGCIILRSVMIELVTAVFQLQDAQGILPARSLSEMLVLFSGKDGLRELVMLAKRFWLVYHVNAIVYLPITGFEFATIFVAGLSVYLAVKKKNLWYPVLFAGMMIATFLLTVAEARITGYRSCQFLPFFTAFGCVLCYLALSGFGSSGNVNRTNGGNSVNGTSRATGKRWGRCVAFILAAVLIYNQAAAMNQSFYEDYRKYENDKEILNQIAYDVASEYGTETPILFVGHYSTPDAITENYYVSYDSWQYRLISAITDPVDEHLKEKYHTWNGYSFGGEALNPLIQWGLIAFDGTNRELIRFMEMHGHSFKTVKDPAVIEEAKRIGDTMPAWPAQGSIAEQDGYILIHIED